MGAPLGVVADVELGSSHLLNEPDHGQVTVVLERHANRKGHPNGRRGGNVVVAPTHSLTFGGDESDHRTAIQAVEIDIRNCQRRGRAERGDLLIA